MLKIQYNSALKVMVVLLLLLLAIGTISIFQNDIIIRKIVNAIFSLLAIAIMYRWLKLNEDEKLYKFKPLKTLIVAVIINIIALSIFILNIDKTQSFKFDTTRFFVQLIDSVIIAAIIEEFWYRRILIGEVFKGSKNYNLLNLIISILFTFSHVRYFLPTLLYSSVAHVFIFSLLISHVYIKTKNFFIVFFIHALGNLIAYFSPLVFQFTQPLNLSGKLLIIASILMLFGTLYLKVFKFSKN